VRVLTSFTALAACLMLTGCLSLGSVSARGTTFDESVGELQNRTILLNIARASLHEPLYFVSVGSAQAVGQVDFHAGLPSVTFGPGQTTEQKQFVIGPGGSNSLDNNTSTNVQLNVFNTRDFYAGLMSPLGLQEVDLLLHQGFSRELVFYLTIDKAMITPPNGKPCYVYNDPLHAEAPPPAASGASICQSLTFDLAIQRAMTSGLTTETVGGAPPPPPPAAPGAPATSGAAAELAAKAPQIQECFDRALATDAANADFDALVAKHISPNFCGAGPHSATSQLVYINGPEQPPYQVQVIFRSTFGIFRYLGSLMNLDDASRLPRLTDYHVPGEYTPVGLLFDVTRTEKLGDSCFTAITYDGHYFCAPQTGDGVEATKDTFNILTTLLALKQSPGDLPASSAVLIAP
jgi:hypothetical protein